MKCKCCGAEVSSGTKICPYCNSEIVEEKPVQIITNNYYGGSEDNKKSSDQSKETNITCPKCGGRSIKFRREEVGNTKSKSGKNVYYRTVGICQDCGYTWNPNAATEKKKHSVWWWILVVLFYPISLTVWFLKTDKIKLKKSIRIGIVVGIWLIFLLIGILAPSTEETAGDQSIDTSVSQAYSEAITFEINNVDLGEYGKKKTLNEGKGEDESTIIEYHIPVGTYTVKNLKTKGAVQLTVYGDDYHITDQGWEEPAESFDSITLMAGKTGTITVKENQYVKCSDGETQLMFEMDN